MKSYALAFVATCVLAGSLAVAAEPAGEAPAIQQMTVDQLRSRLNLSPEQQTQIEPFAAARKSTLESVRTRMGAATERSEKRKLMQEAKQAQDSFVDSVTPILTPAQQTEWKKMRDETRELAKQRIKEKRSAN